MHGNLMVDPSLTNMVSPTLVKVGNLWITCSFPSVISLEVDATSS